MKSYEPIKIIEVPSMTGDCPEDWITEWKSQGYNAIHFVGNGCDDYTLLDQETIIDPDSAHIQENFEKFR